MSGKEKGKETAVTSIVESDSSDAENDAENSDGDLTDLDPDPLVCAVWIAKAGQWRNLSFSLTTIDLWKMTYPEFVAELNKTAVETSRKDAANATISYCVKPLKVAAKATEPPKGLPKCPDFVRCDSKESYESFLKLVRLTLAQMKTGSQPVVQVVGTIIQNSPMAVDDQGVITVASDSDQETDADADGIRTRKVFPFIFQAEFRR